MVLNQVALTKTKGRIRRTIPASRSPHLLSSSFTRRSHLLESLPGWVRLSWPWGGRDGPLNWGWGQSSGIRLPAERARVLLEINNAIVSHLDLPQGGFMVGPQGFEPRAKGLW